MSTGMLEGHGNGSAVEVDADKLAVAGADAAQVTSPAPVEELDVDDLHLAELRKAADAEGPGSTAVQTEEGTQAAPDAGAQPDQQDQQPRGERPKHVPIERFQQVYRSAKDLEAANARLIGENLALKSQAPAAQPTVHPQIAALDQQITALAQKFDEGLMTYAEMKSQERGLQAQIDTIREDNIVARAAQRSQPAAQPAVADLTFQRETQRLEQAYEPYLALIPDTYFDSFVADVRTQLAAEGITEIAPNSEALLLFRERLGQQAQAEAAMWAAKSNKPVPKAGGQQVQPTPARVIPGNQPTVEQRRAKLEMQSDMPPNLGGLLRSGGVEDAPSEASIETMSDDEIAALPASMRNKLLGRGMDG